MQDTVNMQALLSDALKKCKTQAHQTKDCAKDLEANGFDPHVVRDMITFAQEALSYATLYQAYINVSGENRK